jgi:lipopolysaccharide transport system ATP-binding protein
MLYGTVLGLTSDEVLAIFDDIAAFADIGQFIDQPVKNYSSGMYVRLAFAVAINVTPEILVVDEALSVGDEGFQRKCFAKIDLIRDAGATVLFVSHSAGTVIDLCDRAILLDRGEMLAQGTPKHVVSRYQKLLYAPADKVAAIRAEILGEHGSELVCQPFGNGDPHVMPESPREQPQAYWEDGLVPSSTVAYENRGATIEDAHLETLDGRRVNVLAQGNEYVYTYRVNVDRTLTRVRCGMMIRSVTGIEVGGAATSVPQEAMPVAEAGSVLAVRFRFRCLLGHGTYFLNAGVLAELGEGEDYVDRRMDVAMFRVMPMAERIATGFVDLDVVPHLRAIA